MYLYSYTPFQCHSLVTNKLTCFPKVNNVVTLISYKIECIAFLLCQLCIIEKMELKKQFQEL